MRFCVNIFTIQPSSSSGYSTGYAIFAYLCFDQCYHQLYQHIALSCLEHTALPIPHSDLKSRIPFGNCMDKNKTRLVLYLWCRKKNTSNLKQPNKTHKRLEMAKSSTYTQITQINICIQLLNRISSLKKSQHFSFWMAETDYFPKDILVNRSLCPYAVYLS